ncbi:MAG: hypothetical protein GYA50_02165 [Eubacteriaceae bacterium]|nr:hypothetical protein [Eubacteriaceae bacterium]
MEKDKLIIRNKKIFSPFFIIFFIVLSVFILLGLFRIIPLETGLIIFFIIINIIQLYFILRPYIWELKIENDHLSRRIFFTVKTICVKDIDYVLLKPYTLGAYYVIYKLYTNKKHFASIDPFSHGKENYEEFKSFLEKWEIPQRKKGLYYD